MPPEPHFLNNFADFLIRFWRSFLIRFWIAFWVVFGSGFGSAFEQLLDQLLSSFWTSFGPAFGQLSASFWPALGQLLAGFWPAFGHLLASFLTTFLASPQDSFSLEFQGKSRGKATILDQLLDQLLASFWPAFGQLLASSWPAFGQLSASFLASFWLAFCALFGQLLASFLISFCDDFCANFRARFWTTFGWFLGDSNAFSRKPLSKRWKPKILIEKTKFQVEMQEINKNPSEKCCKTAKSYRLGFRVRRFVPDVLVFCKKSVRESAAKPQNRIVFCQYSMFCLQCFSFLQKIAPGNA